MSYGSTAYESFVRIHLESGEPRQPTWNALPHLGRLAWEAAAQAVAMAITPELMNLDPSEIDEQDQLGEHPDLPVERQHPSQHQPENQDQHQPENQDQHQPENQDQHQPDQQPDKQHQADDAAPESGSQTTPAADTPAADTPAADTPAASSTHDASTHDASTHDASTHDASTHDASTHEVLAAPVAIPEPSSEGVSP